LLALFLGPAYLLLVAQILSVATGTSYAVTVALTVVGSLMIMAVLVVFGVKAYKYRHSAIRFTLSSAFLVTVPLAVYLATLRWVIRGAPTQDMRPTFWLWFSAFSMIAMTVTTVILLWLAEAIMWFAVASLRARLGKRRRNGRAKMRN